MKVIEKIKMLWHDSEDTNLHAFEGSRGRFDLVLNGMPVGFLEYKDRIWSFQYSDDFKKQNEYAALVNFPSKDSVYESSQLWPFFASRLPGLNQLKESNDTSLDILSLLRKYATHVISNPYVLLSNV